MRGALREQPHGLVEWLRRLGLGVAVASLALSLPVITSNLHSPPALVAAGITACVLLAGLWLATTLRQGLGAGSVAVTPIGLVIAGVALGSPLGALPLFAATSAWSALWGPQRRAVLLAAGTAGAYVAASAGGRLPVAQGWNAAETAVGTAVILLAGPLAQLLCARLAAHDRAARHGHALTWASAALLQPTSPDSIAAVALGTVSQVLSGDVRAPGIAVALRQDVCLTVGPVTGELPAAAGLELPYAALGPGLREALEAGEPLVTRELPLDGQLVRHDLEAPQLLVVPMLAHGQVRGLIAVADPAVPADTTAALAALGSQVALALETLTLTQGLRESESRFRSLVQNNADVIAVMDVGTTVVYASPAAGRVLGYPPTELRDRRFADLVHPDDAERWDDFLDAVSIRRQRRVVLLRLRHRSGSWRHSEVTGTHALDEPGINGIILNCRDVSERKALEDDLRHQAMHDPLTNLPNRAHFLEAVRAALADPGRRRVALLFIDLDNFKTINDRLGHAAGDEVLIDLAARLDAALDGQGTVCRLGGDEFAVVTDVPGGRSQAAQLAGQLLREIGEVAHGRAQELRIRASIGVAIADSGAEDAADLLRRADLAMYVAKGKGKAGFEIFDSATYASIEVRNRLRADLAGALLGGEIEVRYQPIVNLRTLEIRNAEALVRWRHPDYGLLGPDAFIPLAQEEDLLDELFHVVLRQACVQARSCAHLLPSERPVGVTVNVAPPQLDDPELVEHVRAAVRGAGIAPQLLTLELTENVLVRDPQRAAERMAHLKAIGVNLAIDDFGTGYSSLAYLRRLPVDVLKIDRTFVDGLERPSAGQSLVRTILDLCHDLDLRAVAEGIERPEQLRLLRLLGCRFGQGFLFSRPVTPAAFRALVAAGPLVPGCADDSARTDSQPPAEEQRVGSVSAAGQGRVR